MTADNPALVDPEILRASASVGGPALVREVVGLFRDTAPRGVDDVCAALAAGSQESARRAAHALRGSALAVGAVRLAAACREIEAGDGAACDDLRALLARTLDALPSPDPSERGAIRGETGQAGALVVEDDAPTRHLVRAVLVRAGFRADAVETGEEALDRFDADRHQLVVLDVGLPGMSGVDCCVAIRARAPDVPILMVTADGSPATIETAFACGASDFAVKPLEPTLLGHRARFLHRGVRAVRDASEQRTEARAAAERARTMSSFLASMSHELRTPLNAILGYAELILEDMDDADAHKHDVARIHESGRHLLGLVNDLLDLSRIQAGHLDLRVESLSLRELVAQVAATATPLFARRGLEFTWQVPDTRVRADAQRTRQVLLNLLGNAAKFTARGGGTLSADAVDGVVQIHVDDTGPGIPLDVLPRLFAPFERGRVAPAEGSTGLGLAISYELCRAMGGDLAVRTTVGQGSRFTVSLPAVPSR